MKLKLIYIFKLFSHVSALNSFETRCIPNQAMTNSLSLYFTCQRIVSTKQKYHSTNFMTEKTATVLYLRSIYDTNPKKLASKLLFEEVLDLEKKN